MDVGRIVGLSALLLASMNSSQALAQLQKPQPAIIVDSQLLERYRLLRTLPIEPSVQGHSIPHLPSHSDINLQVTPLLIPQPSNSTSLEERVGQPQPTQIQNTEPPKVNSAPPAQSASAPIVLYALEPHTTVLQGDWLLGLSQTVIVRYNASTKIFTSLGQNPTTYTVQEMRIYADQGKICKPSESILVGMSIYAFTCRSTENITSKNFDAALKETQTQLQIAASKPQTPAQPKPALEQIAQGQPVPSDQASAATPYLGTLRLSQSQESGLKPNPSHFYDRPFTSQPDFSLDAYHARLKEANETNQRTEAQRQAALKEAAAELEKIRADLQKAEQNAQRQAAIKAAEEKARQIQSEKADKDAKHQVASQQIPTPEMVAPRIEIKQQIEQQVLPVLPKPDNGTVQALASQVLSTDQVASNNENANARLASDPLASSSTTSIRPTSSNVLTIDSPTDKLINQFSNSDVTRISYDAFKGQLASLLKAETSAAHKEKMYATIDQFLAARTEIIIGIRYDEVINGKKETVSWGMHYPQNWNKEKIRTQFSVSDIASLLSEQQKLEFILKAQPVSEPGNVLSEYVPLDASTTAQLLSLKYKDGRLPRGPSIKELTDKVFSINPPNAEMIGGYGWVRVK